MVDKLSTGVICDKLHYSLSAEFDSQVQRYWIKQFSQCLNLSFTVKLDAMIDNQLWKEHHNVVNR